MIDAKKLKSEIRKNGITQEELARKSGMDPATLNKKINGKSMFTVNEVQAIASELNIGNDELIDIFFAKELA